MVGRSISFPHEEAPRVTVIVVGLREAPHLLACLASLETYLDGAPYEVLVVLNDPTPGRVTEIEARVSGAEVLSFRANLGLGPAVNVAASRAQGEFLALLNDDCTVGPGWLEALIDTMERRPRCGVVCSTFLDPDGTLQYAGYLIWGDGESAPVVEDGAASMRFERVVHYASGGSMLVRRSLWDQLGGFDEMYYPGYFEDSDFCLRAAQAGWESWYQPESVVHHRLGASSSPWLRAFVVQRSQQKFVERWSGWREPRPAEWDTEAEVWKAMRSPLRTLVIGPASEPGPVREQLLGQLARCEGMHVAYYGAGSASPLPPGVRRIHDLAKHLDTPAVSYEQVVLADGSIDATVQTVIDRFPGVRLVAAEQLTPDAAAGLSRPMTADG